MHCTYCYSPPHEGEPMSEAIGKQAMDFAARISSGSIGIIFFGGEPLLYQSLIRQLVYYGHLKESREEGKFHFKITTNGVLLDNEFIKYCAVNNILIAMSFDGIREAHDRHRRFLDGNPSFDYICTRLKMLLDMCPYSSVIMVVNPDTIRYLCKSVEYLLGMGCRYLIVSLNYAAPWKESDFTVLKSQFEKLGDYYIEWTHQERKFYLSPFEVKISSHINQHCYKKERCELAQKQISVDPQGYLYPCVQFTKEGPQSDWCIGDVYNGIDEEARKQIYIRSEKEKKSCTGCAVKNRCNNTCGCLNWQTTGSIDKISPVLCKYEQVIMPIADRIGKVLYKSREPLFIQKHYNVAYPILSLFDDMLG
jgi:uncharacterized protein